MTVRLELPQSIESRLTQAADARAVSAEELVLQILDQYLPEQELPQAGGAGFEAWLQRRDEFAEKVDPVDREEFFKGLDEHRTSERNLFPEELCGVTW